MAPYLRCGGEPGRKVIHYSPFEFRYVQEELLALLLLGGKSEEIEIKNIKTIKEPF